jgi:hypothetical protein
LLLACFSLGLEEAEQEWGGLHGTKSGPESNRRGRINRASSAAHHLYRAGGGMDDTGDPFVFETASFDLPGRDLTVSGAPAELLVVLSPARAAGSQLNRGPPSLSL